MKRVRFTAKLHGWRCPPGKQQAIYWDDDTPGLGLRVTANGARSYVFESRLDGRTVRTTIGDPRTWSIEDAQIEARRLKVMTDQGIDPRKVRQQLAAQRQAERDAAKQATMLVSEAWEAYVAHHSKRWGERHRRDHANLAQEGGQERKRGSGKTVRGVLRPLLEMPMGEVTPNALAAWMREEATTRPNNARQGFELFRAFWRWCAERPEYRGIIDPMAVETKDLRREVPRRKARLFDVLERGHLAAWFKAVRDLDNQVGSTYLQALLLTGARREEMASLRWKDVDFRWESLWLKDKVEEAGRKVPLTPYLASLLATLPRTSEWVFASADAKGGRIADPRQPHNRALSAAGLPHITLHGLRRSFSTLAEWVEMPRGVVHQIMGHKPSATAEKHYINRPLDLLAIWHGKYEAWLLKEAGVKFKRKRQRKKDKGAGRSNVVPLRPVA